MTLAPGVRAGADEADRHLIESIELEGRSALTVDADHQDHGSLRGDALAADPGRAELQQHSAPTLVAGATVLRLQLVGTGIIPLTLA